MNDLNFSVEIPDSAETLELYRVSGIMSELWDLSRMEKVLRHSSLLMCCYKDKKLVGIARGTTDRYWIAHLSHLAVHPDYQGRGIGKTLISKLKDNLGDGVTLMVHAGPGADSFYKKIGFELYEDVYRIRRTK
jgi:ribosomal protein S18 acetylase RimI-like enzyme